MSSQEFAESEDLFRVILVISGYSEPRHAVPGAGCHGVDKFLAQCGTATLKRYNPDSNFDR